MIYNTFFLELLNIFLSHRIEFESFKLYIKNIFVNVIDSLFIEEKNESAISQKNVELLNGTGIILHV
jgi:hypothetical protein